MAWFKVHPPREKAALANPSEGGKCPRKTAGFLAGGFSKVLAASAAPP